jgi:uncharacterized protein with von Willebrand factor type A (vWA) domain
MTTSSFRILPHPVRSRIATTLDPRTLTTTPKEDLSLSEHDLLKMLDLDGRDSARDSPAPASINPISPATPAELTSPTVLDLDAWALRRGCELLAESDRLKALTLDEHAIADFHACAFEPEPKLLDGCVDQRRHEFVRQLLDTPEYRALHTATVLNDLAAGIAATAFAEQFAELRREEEDSRSASTESGGEIATLKAVGKALARAAEEVEEVREAASTCGLGEGAPGSNDPKRIAELYRRVRSDPILRRIVDLAGRYRRLAQSRQRRKLVHGTDDVTGVVLDGDVGKLLPHELARLVIPDLEDDVLRRIVERQAMCRQMRGSEPVARGPIIVCCDESGSMQGEKNHASKALALALAWVARRQKRWCSLVAYSGDSGERLLPLPPGKWDGLAVLDWLSQFIGRGSSIDVPVRELPDYYARLKAPKGKTDLLFLTDAKVRLPADVRARFLAWKRSVAARLITLVIGSEAGDLATISDETHVVRSLGVDEVCVGRAVSV